MLFEIELEALRDQLDRIDEQICVLLEQRFEITDEVGRLKKSYDQPIDQLSREAQIKQNLTDKLEGYKHLNEILNLYELLFDMSKKSQKNV
ncbi:chorismate mutase [Fusibacter ferrireducens]|uniref:Chorismate mutase n=1 Tax=Fusibacter ferrireducens TaxID=2785058 RepID=A0ABR9ZV78_9FIRM|nr:chorismate mutase [Fusibacter ferrireducens]MBF4694360.1 chorismate mutase [Fusibacter ferrireducens]